MEEKCPQNPAQLDALASVVVIKDSAWEKKLEVAIKNMDSVLKKNPDVVPKNSVSKKVLKNPEVIKSSKVVTKDNDKVKDKVKDKDKNKDSVPKVPKVPKRNPKVIIKDSKVPKNRPPRSQGSGYYSSYYVGGRPGGRVRVWVWVWA